MNFNVGDILPKNVTFMTNNKEAMNLVFVNCNKEDAIYPLTTKEIVESQNRHPDLKSKAEKGIFFHSAGQKYKHSL